jgi:hypothetical protein
MSVRQWTLVLGFVRVRAEVEVEMCCHVGLRSGCRWHELEQAMLLESCGLPGKRLLGRLEKTFGARMWGEDVLVFAAEW